MEGCIARWRWLGSILTGCLSTALLGEVELLLKGHGAVILATRQGQ